MEGIILKLLVDKEFYLLLAFAVGVIATTLFMKKIYGDRLASLKKELMDADARCEGRISDMRKTIERMQKRIDTLEDSRAFILHKHIKDLKDIKDQYNKD